MDFVGTARLGTIWATPKKRWRCYKSFLVVLYLSSDSCNCSMLTAFEFILSSHLGHDACKLHSPAKFVLSSHQVPITCKLHILTSWTYSEFLSTFLLANCTLWLPKFVLLCHPGSQPPPPTLHHPHLMHHTNPPHMCNCTPESPSLVLVINDTKLLMLLYQVWLSKA
jgi:hypothetical protein